MAEIKREPIKIKVGDVEFDAFDEDHTLGDIARWIRGMSDGQGEVDDMITLLGGVKLETAET